MYISLTDMSISINILVLEQLTIICSFQTERKE